MHEPVKLYKIAVEQKLSISFYNFGYSFFFFPRIFFTSNYIIYSMIVGKTLKIGDDKFAFREMFIPFKYISRLLLRENSESLKFSTNSSKREEEFSMKRKK